MKTHPLERDYIDWAYRIKAAASAITIALMLLSVFRFLENPKAMLRAVYSTAYYWIFVPRTFFVRNDGSQNCTGLVDAAYPGSGTGQPCAFSDLQHALNQTTFGDTVKLKAGHTFTRGGGAFASFVLANKGTPPTGTDADYITVTTTDVSGTPAALFGYPATRTRITTAMAANMPHVRIDASTPAFGFNAGAKYWKIERLDISNLDVGVQCIRLIGTGDGVNLTSLSSVMDHIWIRLNWIHPIEETGAPLSSGNVARSAENAIYIDGTNLTIENNAIQGFVGRFRHGGEAGQRMTSAGILISTYADNVAIRNNLLEAWTYAFFAGGSGMPSWAVTHGGTISSCSSPTVCTFSNVTGLAVGDPLSILVNSVATWGSTFVQSISGNTVTFTMPACHSYDGGNSCQTIIGNPTPASGDPVRWRGLQPNNILITRNLFAHNADWNSLMDGDCSGKGYLELKACTNCVFRGNVFFGCTGQTVTVRNQVGDFAWASLDNLSFESNLWEGSNGVFISYLRDTSPTKKSQNVTFHNNLILGLTGNPVHFPGGFLSSNTGGGINTRITHNTVAWSKTNQPGMTLNGWQNFVGFFSGGAGQSNTMEGFVFQNNIIPIGVNVCFDGNTGLPMSSCWPSATISHNVLVNADNHPNEHIGIWWTNSWPNNTVVSGYTPVGFTSPNSTLSIGGNYILSGSSPFRNAGSDGTDIGYHHPTLVNALGYDPNGGPPPSPTPTPSATPTPILPGSICKWGSTPPCRIP